MTPLKFNRLACALAVFALPPAMAANSEPETQALVETIRELVSEMSTALTAPRPPAEGEVIRPLLSSPQLGCTRVNESMSEVRCKPGPGKIPFVLKVRPAEHPDRDGDYRTYIHTVLEIEPSKPINIRQSFPSFSEWQVPFDDLCYAVLWKRGPIEKSEVTVTLNGAPSKNRACSNVLESVEIKFSYTPFKFPPPVVH